MMETVAAVRTVMTRYDRVSATHIYLTQVTDDDDVTSYFVEVERSVWEDMGSPEIVTLTLEAGDHLNAE